MDILHGEKELLCGFSGFLPQGFSIFLENNDLQQVRIRCPAVEDMSVEELKQHVEELKVCGAACLNSWSLVLVCVMYSNA